MFQSTQSLSIDMSEDYKMTELGPLPKEWSVVRLYEVAKKMKAGGTPKRAQNEFWNGSIPFAIIEDITKTNLYLSSTKNTISKFGLEQSNAWLVPPNSLLISMYGTIGHTAINTIPIATNQAILALIPKEEKIDLIFASYLIKYNAKRLIKENVQSTQKNISKQILSRFRIPLPPLPEQRVIAHVLRTVQESKEATQKVIDALHELKKSLMEHLFTYGPVPITEQNTVTLQDTEIGKIPKHWQVVRVADITEKTSQKNPKRNPESEFKYIDVSSIDGNHRISRYKVFKGKNAPSRAKKVVKENDVIFATIRPYLKRIALVPKKLNNEICSTAFCVLRANISLIFPKYLFYSVEQDRFVKNVAAQQKGSSYPAVTDKVIKQSSIPLPPLDEQRKIAEILEAVDRKIEAEEKRKSALEELFRSLLHELMSAKRRLPKEFVEQFDDDKIDQKE